MKGWLYSTEYQSEITVGNNKEEYSVAHLEKKEVCFQCDPYHIVIHTLGFALCLAVLPNRLLADWKLPLNKKAGGGKNAKRTGADQHVLFNPL